MKINSLIDQFLYSQIFIWMIVPVRDALHVDEREAAGFRAKADLFDTESINRNKESDPRQHAACLGADR